MYLNELNSIENKNTRALNFRSTIRKIKAFILRVAMPQAAEKVSLSIIVMYMSDGRMTGIILSMWLYSLDLSVAHSIIDNSYC
jgi:hypothetical protein